MSDESYVVLVLGAGASKEYDFPLGLELRDTISALLAFEFEFGAFPQKGDHATFDAIRARTPNYPREVGEVKRLLAAGREIRSSLSQAPSIDQFIFNRSDRDDIATVGKIAIARAIQAAERRSSLSIFGSERYVSPQKGFKDWHISDTWLPKLFSILVDGCDGIEALIARLGKIRVISFNYDRVFRHFLYHALDNYYPGNAERIGSALKDLVVIHPYGSLGPLEWQDASRGRYFGADLDGLQLREAASSLLTFNESIEEEEVQASAQAAIANASLVMFLGFAYHEQNMRFLQVQNTKNARFFGTAMGLSEFDRSMVKEEIVERFSVYRDSIFLHPGNCASIFNEYSRALRLVGI